MARIEKRGNAIRITAYAGYRPDGTQIRATTTWHPDPNKTEKQNEKALKDFVFEFEKKLRDGLYLDGEKTNFQSYAEEWIKNTAPIQVQATTLASYKDLLRVHIYPAIGKIKMAKLRPHHLNKLYTDLMEHRKDGRPGGYSDATIKRIRALISSILSDAVKDNVITSNPVTNSKQPKQTEIEEKLKYFTIEQAKLFLSALNEKYGGTVKAHDRTDDTGKTYHVDDYHIPEHELPLQLQLFFHMALSGGFRRSELLALDWSDIDFKTRDAHITKAFVKEGSIPIIKVPKSKKSVRTVKLPPEVMDLADKWKKEQEKYKEDIGDKWKGENCVFIKWDGSRMYPDTPSRAFRSVISRHNAAHPDNPLPQISLHALRHTNISILLTEGEDLSQVSNHAGHSSVGVTSTIYNHLIKNPEEKLSDTMGSTLY